jgi:hypothetical protein
MKALTVRQPWAWAITHAGKNIENRDWRTHYRGPLIIHAAAAMHAAPLPRRLPCRPPDEHVRSALVGIVDLVDVVEESCSRWFEGRYGWVFENPRPFRRPIPCKGRLGLWSLSPSQLRAVRRMGP